jgi:DNA ligase 1
MLALEIGAVASTLVTDGAAGLAKFGLTVFRPILPMLAQTAEDPGEALARFEGPAALEHKLDGFRVRIHKADGAVKIFSRALNDVTDSLPELVAATNTLAAKRLILDGDAILLGPDGRPRPFQHTLASHAKSRPAGTALSLSLLDLLIDDQTQLNRPDAIDPPTTTGSASPDRRVAGQVHFSCERTAQYSAA